LHPFQEVNPVLTPAAKSKPHFSFVREVPAADPAAAADFFRTRLSLETDPADLNVDLQRAATGIVVVDARANPDSWEECRIPGALRLPYRSIDETSTRDLPRDAVVVVYCWGPACNAASKAAFRLASLGFRVKELIGGIEYWIREGFEVEGTLGRDAPLYT
jgi:rhodanese-related sulfurtransferase